MTLTRWALALTLTCAAFEANAAEEAAAQTEAQAPGPAETPADAPKNELTPAPSTSPSAAALAENTAPKWWLQGGVAFGAGVVSVPVSLWLAGVVGSLSNNLVAAALPALLVMGLIPPLAVTLAIHLIGDAFQPGQQRWWPTALTTLAIHALVLVVGGFAGATIAVFSRLIVLSVIDAALMAAGGTAVARLSLKDPPPSPMAAAGMAPNQNALWFARLSEGSF